jgi:hypothetical protein
MVRNPPLFTLTRARHTLLQQSAAKIGPIKALPHLADGVADRRIG